MFEGQVIFGQSYTLQSGQTLSGDLLVFGGTAEIQADAKVEGNIVLFGGELTVDGEATGDVAAIGATVTLGPDAHIGGDLVTVGATLEQAETAKVDGQIYNTATSWSEASNGEYPIEPVIPEPEITTPKFNFDFHPFRYFWNVVGNAIFLGLLAMLLMLFLARQAETVAQAAVKQTLTAGGLALLTVIVAPFALLLLSITIYPHPGGCPGGACPGRGSALRLDRPGVRGRTAPDDRPALAVAPGALRWIGYLPALPGGECRPHLELHPRHAVL